MKCFKVTFEETLHYDFYINAESKDEALRIIDEIGGAGNLNFDICNAEVKQCDIVSVDEVEERG